ncbi:hypothetical protein LguiA_022260 [Lonicera macranthoides]
MRGAMGKRISVETLASTLEHFKPEEQRTVLDNNLYPLVEQLEGREAAYKVTGVLLELDQNNVNVHSHFIQIDVFVSVLVELMDEMKKIAKLDVELTVEEQHLLRVGYTNSIGPWRNSWWILSSIMQKEEGEGNEVNAKLIRGYREKVESELETICNDMLALIDEHLIPSSSSEESNVFLYKLKGDYYRYLAEFKGDIEKEEVIDQSLKAYETAITKAESYLSPAHPNRLTLSLNVSVFYCDIVNNPERGCHLAKQAYDEAIAELDSLSEESYRNSTSIMQILRQNLFLWTSGAMGKPISIEVLASVLKDFTPEEQRIMIAGNLYPLVLEQLEDEEANKVTDMLLEFDQNKVLHLLESPEALKAEVAEAMEVLRNVTESPSAAAVDDQLDALSFSDDSQ